MVWWPGVTALMAAREAVSWPLLPDPAGELPIVNSVSPATVTAEHANVRPGQKKGVGVGVGGSWLSCLACGSTGGGCLTGPRRLHAGALLAPQWGQPDASSSSVSVRSIMAGAK